MSLLASFNGGGNLVIGLILLPFFLAWPWAMLFFEVRAFLRSEAQSILIFLGLLLAGTYAGFMLIPGSFTEFSRTTGFWKGWMISLMLATAACPIVLGWEAYKHGWIKAWWKPTKKRKRRKELADEV